MQSHDRFRLRSGMVAYVIDVSLGLALLAAFLAVAGHGVVRWMRRRDPVCGWLGLAAAFLAAVCLAFRIDDVTGSRLPFLTQASALALLGSAYALVMLRASVIPLRRRTAKFVCALLAAAGVAVAAVRFPTGLEGQLGGAHLAVLGVVCLLWSGCVVEPMIRFWRRSRDASVVQRARMRGLSVGYGGLVAVLVVAAALIDTGSSSVADPAEIFVLVISIILVGVQHVAFAPPRWIRRMWREREERALLHATGSDIFSAGDRDVAAARALHWAVRLVGAEHGVFADVDRRLLSVEGFAHADAAELVARLPANGRARIDRVCGRSAPESLVVPVRLDAGVATIILVAGPFTPPFGADETLLVDRFGETVAAALDRLRVDEMRSVFLNAVSHELRTPLTSVLGMGQTLQRPDIDRLSGEQRRGLVDGLVRNAERLDRMLSDLLDLDRLSRGVLAPRRRTVDVHELMQRVLEGAESVMAGRRVVVEVPGPVRAAVDAPMVERIVENLLANAAKHTPVGSTVWMSADASGTDLVISVADDGCGVPDSQRETIFEPFRRGSSAPSHSPGSGIGLSLVARFAQLHDGSAWVEDRPEGGAVFKVRLPGSVSSEQPGPAVARTRG